MEFENPYADKPSLARPIPGVIAQQMASMAEMWLKMLGITLYVHEHEGLAHFMGAILRGFPKLGDFFKPTDPPQ